MVIQQLPDYLINRLKAGEIVERPVSVIKELVENSLDAGAKHIVVTVKDGGKSSIIVEDDGAGIEILDMDKVLARYATSKMSAEHDLQAISSYGFRGEALASIAEVSKVTIQTKTAFSEVAMQLTKRGDVINQRVVPVSFDHGTSIIVEDLFYNVPARLKFMRSAQTEYFYCYNYLVDIALCRPDIYFVFKKNNNVIFNLKPVDNLVDRVWHIFKKDWSKNIRVLDYQENGLMLSGVIGNAGMRFGSAENIKIFVNKRPVQDRIIKKSILDAYRRQIHAGEYPLAFVFVDIDPQQLDVNVHPKKMEVKFVDSQKIFSVVLQQISALLGEQKVIASEHGFSWWWKSDIHLRKSSSASATQQLFGSESSYVSSVLDMATQMTDDVYEQVHDQLWHYRVIGQLWDMYIVVAAEQELYYIDQHALAERIAFEKLRKDAKNNQLISEPLLQPIVFDVMQRADLEDKLTALWSLWLDVWLFGDNKVAVYAVPQVFTKYQVDIEKLLEHLLSQEGEMLLDHVLDMIFATKACKTSIKAGEKLNYYQMENLIREWLSSIDGMFVCQHGRPFFIQIDKKQIDGMMHR
jgi:DNA mismatch repair protein MutL